MPIRRELRPLYPPHWRELSDHVRFKRAGGRCQRCDRPHLALVRCLPDGRWFDEQATTWRDRRGRMARWPDLVDATRFRITRVVLATAHLDGDPTNNRWTNLRALCQRCHMLHDGLHHLAQRWITYRRRRALGDLFLGPYAALIATLRSDRTASVPGIEPGLWIASSAVTAGTIDGIRFTRHAVGRSAVDSAFLARGGARSLTALSYAPVLPFEVDQRPSASRASLATWSASS
jgi:hypothetical protein